MSPEVRAATTTPARAPTPSARWTRFARKIELLSSVTESSLNRLTKSQLVGVVSDLLAMAARQEYERARRFEAATASAEAKKAREKAERVAAARRAREKAEASRRRVERAAQTAAAMTIQRHWRGHASRQRQNHHRRALIAYAEEAAAIEARVQATRRRDAAAMKIQSEWRGRVARAEANRRWLEAWSERRDARNLESAAREDAMEMREREDREADAREEWRRMNAAGGDVKNALSALKSRRRSGRAPRPDPPPYRGDDDEVLGFVVDAGEEGKRGKITVWRWTLRDPARLTVRRRDSDSTRTATRTAKPTRRSPGRTERDPKRAVTGSLHQSIGNTTCTE